MLIRRGTRNLGTSLLLVAAGAALALLWAARRQPAFAPAEEARERERQREPVRILPATSNSFDGQPELTAAPHESPRPPTGADDYEALSPDELSAAFLSRATESWSKLEPGEPGAEAELQGFQIATLDDLTLPEPSDGLADFEFLGTRPKPRTGG
jgi:hypothetical protein